MAETVTITNNSTGESVEVPIEHGAIDSSAWRKVLPGIWFYDDAFMTTASCKSSITYLDGDNGILRYRGYPIEQLAEQSTYLEVAYLLVFGELPSKDNYDKWVSKISEHMFLHESMKKILDAFRYDAHPMGIFTCMLASLSTMYPEAKYLDDSGFRHLQTLRMIGKAPAIAAFAHRYSKGMPVVYPDNSLGYVENFMSMMWRMAEPRYEANPVLVRALDLLFVLHADHEQNCSTTAMRAVSSAHADPYVAAAAASAALFGPRHGGANEDVLRTLNEIGSYDNVADVIKDVKEGKRKLAGFGHRVYKNFDPRARIIKEHAHRVFEVVPKNPLLDIALKLEETALSDDYFISRKLYPNIDFYSGLIYEAMGFTPDMFTVLFAIPRVAGWMAHWEELVGADNKIARPRQVYTGLGERNYQPMHERVSN